MFLLCLRSADLCLSSGSARMLCNLQIMLAFFVILVGSVV